MARNSHRPDFTSVTIVLLGVFNPDLFFPNALADAKVLSRKDEKVATFKTLVPGAAVQFDLLWGEVLVGTDRFQITTTEAPYVRICDFAIKALSDLQKEPRIRAFGINVESHFNLGSVAERDEIGVKLAPPQAWGKWGKEVLASMSGPSELHGGVFRLQMRQPFAAQSISGWLEVTVGPSSRIPNNTGIFFRTNHHHHFSAKILEAAEASEKGSLVPDGRLLLDALAERFDTAVSLAEDIFRDVIEG